MDMISITKPLLGEEEAATAREVILSGWVTQGPRVKQFEEAFAAYVGAKYACAVSSCTTALHLALLAVGVKPGDTVITVSHSFIATANAVRYCGAEPIFVDIDPATYNIDPSELEKCLREKCEEKDGILWYKYVHHLAVGQSPLCYIKKPHGRIAAIMPVHQMGMPCDLKKILKLAKEFNLPVVEDAACAIGSEISLDAGKTWERIGKPHGDVACFSFHPRKIITTGDGGMLTTSNKKYDNQFRLLRQHGMSIPDTVRHKTKKVLFEKYTIHGFNFRMTDIQAAVGIEQLKRLPDIIAKRRSLAGRYVELLKGIEWLSLPDEPEHVRTNWQSYPVRILDNSSLSRNDLMQKLLDAGISTRPGIMNAHQERAYYAQNWQLTLSEKARDEVALLPMYYGLAREEMARIANALLE